MQKSTPDITSIIHRARLFVLPVALTLHGPAGCTFDRADASASASLAQVADEAWTLRDPSGVYTAEVRALGEGCPFDSWRPKLSADGKLLAVTFTRLLASVSPNLAFDRSDCIVDVKLRTTRPRSFAVQRFGYSGTADLEPGTSGSESASYAFAGARANTAPHYIGLSGPFRNVYRTARATPAGAEAWSPCGLEHDLSILTVVSVANGNPGGWGSMDMSSTPGSDAKLLVELGSRECAGPATPQPALGPIAAPTNLSVYPSSVRGDQPFTVRWEPLPAQPDALYVVQLSTPGTGAELVHWRSTELIDTTSVVYDGPALRAGVQYAVSVHARVGSELAVSAPVTLRALAP